MKTTNHHPWPKALICTWLLFSGWGTAKLCGSVLTGSLAWMFAPALITLFINLVCSALIMASLDDIERTCVRDQDVRDALPSVGAVFAVAILLGVIWALWYFCHTLGGTARGWLLIPILGALAIVAALDAALIKGLCDRNGGET